MSSTSLNLQVRPGTDVLQRVIGTCRRRGLSIVALTYEDRQLAITLTGSHRRTGQIQQWLAGLIDVLDVGQDDGPRGESARV
jgi:acetolactate synthase regulatory subunit